MSKRDMAPIHPGEILLEDFLKPLEITQYRLAQDIGVGQTKISQIVRGKRGISADTALRLARYFGTSAEFWMNAQAWYELEVAKDKAGEAVEREVTPREPVAA